MLKKLLFLTSILFISFVQGQQNQLLSPQAEISVLTIGPGASLNDAFGHSAFRIKDPIKGTDLVFNYGVYDFNTPNFYLKFAQGKLNYLIGLNYYEDFFETYVSQNRTIKEQVLNVSSSEKQKLFDYLLNNIKPENRAYLYDFFYDNCATRIRDVLEITTDSKIVYENPESYKAETFRTLIHSKLNSNSWGALGIDIALGSVIDREATAREHMFLPDFIFDFFESAKFTSTDERLVKNTNILFEKIDQPKADNFLTSPLLINGILSLLIIFLTFKDSKKARRSNWLDVLIFGFTGILGVFIILLWFATDHHGTHQNYNLLWAFALNLLVISQLFKTKASAWFHKYLKFLLIMLCLLALHWIIGVQVYAITLIPFLIALVIRYIYLIKHFGNSQ